MKGGVSREAEACAWCLGPSASLALGLFAFFYGTLHFFSYLALDQFFSLEGMLADVGKRPFITAGFVSFVAMVPLAVTSTTGWTRRLGRRWQELHRLMYLAAAAGAVHYLWKVKVAIGSPVYYAIIVGALLAFRVRLERA